MCVLCVQYALVSLLRLLLVGSLARSLQEMHPFVLVCVVGFARYFFFYLECSILGTVQLLHVTARLVFH